MSEADRAINSSKATKQEDIPVAHLRTFPFGNVSVSEKIWLFFTADTEIFAQNCNIEARQRSVPTVC